MGKSRTDIVKSNAFINSYLSGSALSLTAARLVYACLLQVKSKNNAFDHERVFIIRSNDLSDITGRKSRNGYKLLIQTCKKELQGSGFTTRYTPNNTLLFPDEPAAKRYISVIDSITYINGEARITFTPSVIPYITELRWNFTLLMANHIMPMKSKYGGRLYELCASWTKPTREIAVSEFRELMGVKDKHPEMSNLKTSVIRPALSDINQYTNLKVKFDQIKIGRNVTSFIFNISKPKKEKPLTTLT